MYQYEYYQVGKPLVETWTARFSSTRATVPGMVSTRASITGHCMRPSPPSARASTASSRRPRVLLPSRAPRASIVWDIGTGGLPSFPRAGTHHQQQRCRVFGHGTGARLVERCDYLSHLSHLRVFRLDKCRTTPTSRSIPSICLSQSGLSPREGVILCCADLGVLKEVKTGQTAL